jgi:hypothetical protein
MATAERPVVVNACIQIVYNSPVMKCIILNLTCV